MSLELPASSAASVPLSCSDCALGRMTAYGPTLCNSPVAITHLRKEICEFPPQRIILRAGQVSPWIHTIFKGWAIRYRQLPEGRRQILSFLIPGDFIVVESLLFGPLVVPFTVKSLTPLITCKFNAQELRASLMSPTAPEEQHRKLTRIAENYVDRNTRRLVDVGQRSAAGRVAQLMLELHERLGRRDLVRNHSLPFPLRQEDIADALGLTSTYVNRVLAQFRDSGYIELKQQTLTILNQEALESMLHDI